VVPVLIIVAVEKAFLVYLTFSNLNESFAAGFRVPAAMDAIIVVYALLYFLSLRAK